MRSSLKFGIAALLAGSAVLGAASAAFAGADDGGNKAFWQSTSSNPAIADTKRDSGRYTARYAPESAVQSKTVTPDKDPPGFYHAMGTMGVP